MADYDVKLWDAVMLKGKKQEKGITHNLTHDEVETIVATAMALGSHENFVKQAYWDLTVAKYKLFDWIAMLVQGRNKGYGELKGTSEEAAQEKFTKIMAYLYITKTIPELIEDLRYVDYELNRPFEELKERGEKAKEKYTEAME